jgi:iron-sulfur cluster repair protein YtfE (RIC family)
MSQEDALTFLRRDHDAVRRLLADLRKTTELGSRRCFEAVRELKSRLETHTALEEEIFYPAFRDEMGGDPDTTALYYEAIEEHRVVHSILCDVAAADPTSPAFGGKTKVLADMVLHHFFEEENVLFPRVEQALTKAKLIEIAIKMRQRWFDLEGAVVAAE